jgi:hypothetical protein
MTSEIKSPINRSSSTPYGHTERRVLDRQAKPASALSLHAPAPKNAIEQRGSDPYNTSDRKKNWTRVGKR